MFEKIAKRVFVRVGITVVLTVILTGCLALPALAAGEQSMVWQLTPSQDGRSPREPVPFGHALELAEISLTVIGTTDITEQVEDAFFANDAPAPGLVFLRVHVRLSKTSEPGRLLEVSRWDFDLFSGEGVQLERCPIFFFLPETAVPELGLESIELYGNPTLERTLCFSAPSNLAGVLLRYDASPFDEQDARWLAVQADKLESVEVGMSPDDLVPFGSAMANGNLQVAVGASFAFTEFALDAMEVAEADRPASRVLFLMLVLTNTGRAHERERVAHADFDLFDSRGVQLGNCYAGTPPDWLDNIEEIRGGSTLIRELCFVVPEGAVGLVLRYDAHDSRQGEHWFAVFF